MLHLKCMKKKTFWYLKGVLYWIEMNFIFTTNWSINANMVRKNINLWFSDKEEPSQQQYHLSRFKIYKALKFVLKTLEKYKKAENILRFFVCNLTDLQHKLCISIKYNIWIIQKKRQQLKLLIKFHH